ncbi:hypothetical protein HQ520_03390, partial [bacterium]|nr:hypothetical protein [bacterium]
YALTLIQSDRPRTWDLFVGSDDGVTIWLNSREILRSTRSRPLVPNEDVVAASFRKGRNTLLVKSTNIMGYWAFTFRLYSPDSSVPTPLPEEGASFIP